MALVACGGVGRDEAGSERVPRANDDAWQSLSSGQIALGPDGSVYLADRDRVLRVSVDGGATTVVHKSADEKATRGAGRSVTALAFDRQGVLLVADAEASVVRRVVGDGTMSTIAGMEEESGFSGDGGPATSATLDDPNDIAVDLDGNLYIADIDNRRVRKVSRDGTITTVAGRGHPELAVSPETEEERALAHVPEPTGDGGPATSAIIKIRGGLALDRRGSLYISEGASGLVRRVGVDGVITTVAGSGVRTGDEGPSTNHELAEGKSALKARLFIPQGVDVDADGNLYIADGQYNNLVRMVDTAGTITTVAGVAGAGFRESSRTSIGDGGPAKRATLHNPVDVAVDRTGVIYIYERPDFESGPALRVRKVDKAGKISTLVTMPRADAARGAPGAIPPNPPS